MTLHLKGVSGFRVGGARFALLLAILGVTFMAGFAMAMLFRPRAQPQVTSVPPTDFDISLPEGPTTITITDPRLQKEEIARFVVTRQGASVTGLPEVQKQIAPRARLSPDDASFFRHELAGIINPADSVWQRANRIRNWLALRNYKTAMPGLTTRAPREAYTQMRQGRPVLCGNLAEIYVALCESAGLVARAVGLSLMVRDGKFGNDTHAGAEIWVPEMGGWIYQDSTFNCYWEIDGKPASALQLHDALMDDHEIKLVSPDPKAESLVRGYYIDPRFLFRHISYEYKAGGPLLYYVDGRLEPLNMYDKLWLQTGDRNVIQGLDTNGNSFIERRGEIAPGIFAQLIGNVLFIRDRRDQNRGIRVRSSSGAVEVCAYEHWRAEELGLFQGRNLVRNGSFNSTGKGEGIAADWSVSGPVEVLTSLGGQGMAAKAGGRLWQHVQVQSNVRYLMYAKVSVARGAITWSIADVSRGRESKGVVQTSQMTEILSDVVESQSGYLDVSFEVPEGGGFRVMDVIVAEVPARLNRNPERDKTVPRVPSNQAARIRIDRNRLPNQ
jgi:hypothetical protein